MIAQLEARIKEYEQALANTPMGAVITELKTMLDVAKNLAQTVAPESSITSAVEAVDSVVDTIVDEVSHKSSTYKK